MADVSRRYSAFWQVCACVVRRPANPIPLISLERHRHPVNVDIEYSETCKGDSHGLFKMQRPSARRSELLR